MYLLLDQCCGKALARRAETLGHTAQRSVDVPHLGQGASDDDVFGFSRSAGAVLVTVNRGDFIGLGRRQGTHPGTLLLPSLPTQRLLPLFEKLLLEAEPIIAGGSARIVELRADGSIRTLPSSDDRD